MVTKLQTTFEASTRRFLRLPEVKQTVGLGRSAIYAKIKKGEFPSAVSLGERAVAWLSDDIAAWMDARIGASRNAPSGR